MTEAKLQHGYFLRIHGGAIRDRFEFQFNPTQVEREMKTVWREPEYPGSYLGPVQFVRFAPQTIRFDLFLYGRGKIGIEPQLARLELFCSPGKGFVETNTHLVGPGTIKIMLGSICCDAVITGLSEKRTQFNQRLQTTVATVGVQVRLISTGPASELAYLAATRKRAYLDG